MCSHGNLLRGDFAVGMQAEEVGMKVSMFERLQAARLAPLLLDTQYRMHPVIAAFPSRTFYKGALLSHPTSADRPAPAGMAAYLTSLLLNSSPLLLAPLNRAELYILLILSPAAGLVRLSSKSQ